MYIGETAPGCAENLVLHFKIYLEENRIAVALK